MPYTLIDLGQDLVPWRVNLNNDVLFEAQGAGDPLQVRLAGGELIVLPSGLSGGVGISDNGLVITSLADGGSAWCDIATGAIEPIVMSGLGSAQAQAMNNRGDVAGSVGNQAFIITYATRAVTLVAPSVLPSPLSGVTSASVVFNDINDQGQAVGVQQWLAGENQLEQPLWFDGASLHPIGAPTFIANGILITEDLSMRVWHDTGITNGDSIFDAPTGALTPFAGFINGMSPGGQVLWNVQDQDDASYLTTPAGTTPMIDLFPAGSGYASASGTRMSQAGTLIGFAGKDDGTAHGVMLIPERRPLPFRPPIGEVLVPTIIIEEAGGIVEVFPGDAPGPPEVFRQGGEDAGDSDR